MTVGIASIGFSLTLYYAALRPFNALNSDQYEVAIPAELCEYVRVAAITEE